MGMIPYRILITNRLRAWMLRYPYRMLRYRWALPCLLGLLFLFSVAGQRFDLLDPYVQLVLIYVGINIILTVSLNLVNGYMGEFSVGHAGFMAVGAYTASLITVKLLPAQSTGLLFPLAVICGG